MERGYAPKCPVLKVLMEFYGEPHASLVVIVVSGGEPTAKTFEAIQREKDRPIVIARGKPVKEAILVLQAG